jgi:hypothetical protein
VHAGVPLLLGTAALADVRRMLRDRREPRRARVRDSGAQLGLQPVSA